jgi:hypothetical protein
MILIGTSVNDVATGVSRPIEAHRNGILCSSSFRLRTIQLRFAIAANLPEPYRAATDGSASLLAPLRAAQPLKYLQVQNRE